MRTKNKNTIVVLTTSNENLYDEKFFDPIGPNGEMLLEYTIFDAIKTGFEKVILVVADSGRYLIKRRIQEKFKKYIQIRWVNINPMSGLNIVDKIPYQVFSYNSYALWKAKRFINGPFLVVSGHFYHGKNLYRKALNFMTLDNGPFTVISHPLGVTLSGYGGVDRGICITQGKTNILREIIELKKIRKQDHGFVHEEKNIIELSEETLATTGVFCLNTSFFSAYRAYLKSNMIRGRISKNKATIPSLINYSIEKKLCKARAETVRSNWFSIKYKPERVLAISKIREMINGHQYPSMLYRTYRKKQRL